MKDYILTDEKCHTLNIILPRTSHRIYCRFDPQIHANM